MKRRLYKVERTITCEDICYVVATSAKEAEEKAEWQEDVVGVYQQHFAGWETLDVIRVTKPVARLSDAPLSIDYADKYPDVNKEVEE